MGYAVASINHTASIQGCVKLLHLCSETWPWLQGFSNMKSDLNHDNNYCYVTICIVRTYMCFLTLILYTIYIYIPLLIVSGVYVRDSAVCGIYITKHIIIDVHHWNSTFQLTAFGYTISYVHMTAHSIVEMTNLWWVGSLLLVLCMVSIALLIVAAEAVTARLAGSD